ncbi:CNP1-like family protein [uncultured Xylophilus sp.]|uniref:CNP1-like family protein n=1 Tax=uncultured Xylophilus sp. TaxID=296832 RepID=UPI0025FA74C2|nr:CNP1-like family protein [uncultured Xylophilus sp.]
MRLADNRHRLLRRAACTAAGLLLAGSALAANMLVPPPEGGYPEDAAPPPPAFDIGRAIVVGLPNATSVVIAVDPDTITLGRDGVVRYVAIARSVTGGAVTAMYEGVRCATAEVKVYARHFADGGWKPIGEPTWQSLHDAGPSRYSLPIAKAGVCRESAPNGSPRQIAADLRNPLTLRSP